MRKFSFFKIINVTAAWRFSSLLSHPDDIDIIGTIAHCGRRSSTASVQIRHSYCFLESLYVYRLQNLSAVLLATALIFP